MSRVLVAYGTRYGSTAEIAAAVGDELTSAGFDVDVLHMNAGIEVRKYDAVIAGSPVYGGKWLPEAAVFLVANAAGLAGKPVALFSAGMLGVKNPKSAIREHEHIVRDLQQVAQGIAPQTTALFHGSFSRSRLHMCLRIMDRLAGTPQGDHRDWSAIRSWGQRTGERFKQALESDTPPGAMATDAQGN